MLFLEPLYCQFRSQACLFTWSFLTSPNSKLHAGSDLVEMRPKPMMPECRSYKEDGPQLVLDLAPLVVALVVAVYAHRCLRPLCRHIFRFGIMNLRNFTRAAKSSGWFGRVVVTAPPSVPSKRVSRGHAVANRLRLLESLNQLVFLNRCVRLWIFHRMVSFLHGSQPDCRSYNPYSVDWGLF